MAAPASNVVPITAAKTTVQADTGGSGAKLGILIAAAGIAAAAGLFFFLQSTKNRDEPKAEAKTTAAVTAAVDESAKPTEDEPKAAAPTETAKPDDGSVDLNDLADASAKPSGEPEVGGPGPAAGGKALAENDPKGPPKIERVDPDGTLEDEMKKHAGPGGEKSAEPASEDVRPKNVPDQPAQGVVTSAVGAVMGGARGCVSGADDVSRATITFGSSGAVQSVSVSGWAAGKPAASCIQSALKGANVGPFAKPSFTFGVTIRP